MKSPIPWIGGKSVAERFKFSHLEAICLVLNCDISDILKLI